MPKKIKEFAVRFQRTRLSDCTRLMFSPNRSPGWYDLDSDPYIQPIYEIPREKIRGRYRIDLGKGIYMDLDTSDSRTYNDLVRKVCKVYQDIYGKEQLMDLYLFAIHFFPDKTGYTEIDETYYDNVQAKIIH